METCLGEIETGKHIANFSFIGITTVLTELNAELIVALEHVLVAGIVAENVRIGKLGFELVHLLFHRA